ncbi:MAG TPA: InlB B-repeat-containing protein, partial [Bacillota bacterium]|nr:InlB B-repeat-containing protein [Bacillota bacterium]
EDQVFVGWYLDTDFTVAFDNNQPITSDLTLYAFFTDAYHNVRFITPGTSVSDIVVANLDTFTLPQTTLSGYRFLGWYLEPDFITLYEVAPVVEDLTLYAKFEQIIYYQVDVYVQDELIESLTVEENTTFDLPDVSVEGYTFQGWYIDAEFSEPYISGEIQSDITLYAYMEINSYTITLNFDGQIDTIIYQYLETPSINEPSKSDYDFAGWYFDPNYQDRYFVEPVTEDLTLYAKFIPLAYVIDLYVLNAYYDSIYIEPDEIPVMPEIIFDGYVFSGWYSDNSYTVLYQPAVLTQDIALYGKYDAIQYLIRFFDGNNQVLSADYLTWNDEINYPDGPDKASTDTFDFVFSHWSTTQKYVNSNLDIYPVYDKIFKPESVTLSLSVDTIYLNQTYQEVSIILKDLSLSVTIESDLNTHETGKYEIRYLIYDGDDLIY